MIRQNFLPISTHSHYVQICCVFVFVCLLYFLGLFLFLVVLSLTENGPSVFAYVNKTFFLPYGFHIYSRTLKTQHLD